MLFIRPMRLWVVVFVVCLTAFGCRKKAENVPPGEAYGCIGLVNDQEINCTELDADTTVEERIAFATACTTNKIKRLGGRVVRHCGTEAVATCSLPNEKATQRMTKQQASSEARRGAALGCKMRGGTYSEAQ